MKKPALLIVTIEVVLAVFLLAVFGNGQGTTTVVGGAGGSPGGTNGQIQTNSNGAFGGSSWSISGLNLVGTAGAQIGVGGLAQNISMNGATDVTLNTFGGSFITTLNGFKAPVVIANSTNSVSGCSLTASVGGGSAGKFASGTSGTCTVTVTMPITAPNGWTCDAHDLTTAADANNMVQTAFTTTTATIAGTTVSGDVITWKCAGF